MQTGSSGDFKVGALSLAKAGRMILPLAGAPTNGTSGSYAGKAGKGALLFDYTNGNLYQNQNTKASPTWVPVAGASALNATQVAVVDLTNAQIKAVRATPVQLVAAPGVGKVIVPINVVAFLKYGGTNAFTAAAGENLALKRKDGSGAVLASGCVQAFLQNTGSAMSEWIYPTASTNELKAAVDNQALVVHNTTASEIAGNAAADNTLRIVVAYQIVADNI